MALGRRKPSFRHAGYVEFAEPRPGRIDTKVHDLCKPVHDTAPASHASRLHHWPIGCALLMAGPKANAAADGADSLEGLLSLLLWLAAPVLLLLLGLALWRWAWKQRSAVGARPRTVDEDPAARHPGWAMLLDRASLAFLAVAFVGMPIGLLVDSMAQWLRQGPDAMGFALGPGLYLCYLPVAVGLLLLSRRRRGLSTAGLMALATGWLLLAHLTPLSVLQMNVATYRKLADPGPLDYLRLVLPLRHAQTMMAAWAWLLALTLLRSGKR